MSDKTGGEPFERRTERAAMNGQHVTAHDGPGEIASWYFPHETPEDDKMRESLKADIEGIIERRLGEYIERRKAV